MVQVCVLLFIVPDVRMLAQVVITPNRGMRTEVKKKVSKKMAESLLSKGRVSVTGLYSQKTGRNFDADLVLDDTGEYVNFKLDFSNIKKKG